MLHIFHGTLFFCPICVTSMLTLCPLHLLSRVLLIFSCFVFVYNLYRTEKNICLHKYILLLGDLLQKLISEKPWACYLEISLLPFLPSSPFRPPHPYHPSFLPSFAMIMIQSQSLCMISRHSITEMDLYIAKMLR